MDMDFWAARIQTRVDNINSSEDELRAWFPCPFCYTEIELQLFQLHLQEEHCFHFNNNAVCPICAANLGKDPLAHFTLQHPHSIKRRKTAQKSGIWNNMKNTDIVKDLKELSSHFGSESAAGIRTNPPVLNDTKRDTDSSHIPATLIDTSAGSRPDSTVEEELRRRSAFLHQLLFSTLFNT